MKNNIFKTDDSVKYYVRGTLKGNCLARDLKEAKDIVSNYGAEEICLVTRNQQGELLLLEANNDDDLLFKIKKRIEHMFCKKHFLGVDKFFTSNLHNIKYENFCASTIDLLHIHGLEVTQENFDYMGRELHKMKDDGVYSELFERID